MIICHCNRISDQDIRGAVNCLKAKCPGSALCALSVYSELGKCPKCCNCLGLAEQTISKTAHEAHLSVAAPDSVSAVAAARALDLHRSGLRE